MARKAGGVGQLAEAREALRTAKTAAELRAAQAVVLRWNWDYRWRRRRRPSVGRSGQPALCAPATAR